MNWRGGKGNNIEDDLAKEISNKLGKTIVQRMGPNKSIESISKQCKAVSGIKEVIENFDKVSSIQKPSSEHTIRNTKNDGMEIITTLIKLDPFDHQPVRFHRCFPDIKRSPM